MKKDHVKVLLSTCLLSGLCMSCIERERPCAVPKEPVKEVGELSFLKAEGTQVVDEQGGRVVLAGVNLGNWLLLEMWMLDIHYVHDQYEFEQTLEQRFGAEQSAALMELYRENWIRERDFEIVKTFGFNVVRLPFYYTLLMEDGEPFQLRPDAFKWLDRAIELAKKNDLYVILDMHGMPGGQSTDHTTGRTGLNELWTSPLYRRQAAWLWQRIAERYADEPAVAAYDLINEPFGDYETDAHLGDLVATIEELYTAVREKDSRHMIIIPGARQGIEFYGAPADHGWENVMYTEHYYPGVHGGAPTLATHRYFISHQLAWVTEHMEQIQAPFLVGEFNVVFRQVGGPILMRHYYDLFARNGWAATMWSYKLVQPQGGATRDNWFLVKNAEDMPPVDIRTSSLEEIEAWFRWFGEMPYWIYDDLRNALTAEENADFVFEDPSWLQEPPAQDDLPGWQAMDIGARPGGQKQEGDTVVVYGGGEDIWKNSDHFRFVWQRVAGDMRLEATIESLSEVHDYAKAGIMLRGSTAPDAAQVLLNVFPNSQVVLGWRPSDGSMMEEQKSRITQFPVRLRLVRRGSRVQAAFSVDGGTTWEAAGQCEVPGLPKDTLAGLAVLSHDDRFLAEAHFQQVDIHALEDED